MIISYLYDNMNNVYSVVTVNNNLRKLIHVRSFDDIDNDVVLVQYYMYYSNNQIHVKCDKLSQQPEYCEYVEYYQNGVVKIKSNILSSIKLGRLGEISAMGVYTQPCLFSSVNIVYVGEFKQFYETGKLLKHSFYDETGNIVGVISEYYARGQIKRHENKDGTFIEYFENGKLKTVHTLSSTITYNENGELISLSNANAEILLTVGIPVDLCEQSAVYASAVRKLVALVGPTNRIPEHYSIKRLQVDGLLYEFYDN